jgi:hypothetical protein
VAEGDRVQEPETKIEYNTDRMCVSSSSIGAATAAPWCYHQI